MTGVERIAKERKRQIEEKKWSKTHDDQHRQGELADAAACYAFSGSLRWPWYAYHDKRMKRPVPYLTPSMADLIDFRIRELEKSGALVAAEIDRLQRTKGRCLSQRK